MKFLIQYNKPSITEPEVRCATANGWGEQP